jgi:hypothetical protein
LVADYLYFSNPATTVVVERRVRMPEVAAARAAADPRPGWYSILLKAYALAARTVPDLRRSLLTFPYFRLYEHAESTAMVAVERVLDGENAVFTYPLRRPESKSLADIDSELGWLRTAPLAEVGAFRRSLRLLRLPRPLRRALMWLALRVRGRWRDRFYGTFAASNVAPAGGALTLALCPQTSFLAPAPVEADGSTTLRVFFDHRVTDGAPVARALVAMEEALRGPILDELLALAPQLREAV